jgi:hypothetical protein
MTADELGFALRGESGHFMRARRGIATLSAFNIAAMGVVSLYQVGVIRRLPHPTIPGFDSERVVGSAEAYGMLETPDGALAVGSYALTLVLAATGSPDRSIHKPWSVIAMAAKTAIDTILVARSVVVQTTKYRSLCALCLLSGVAAITAMALSVPETLAALRSVRERTARRADG